MIAATAPTNPGTVVSVRGSVVDVRFDGRLPPIYSVLRAGEEKQIFIEVLAQRDARHVQGIALTPILNDEFKDYPERALYMVGAVNEAKGKATPPE